MPRSTAGPLTVGRSAEPVASPREHVLGGLEHPRDVLVRVRRHQVIALQVEREHQEPAFGHAAVEGDVLLGVAGQRVVERADLALREVAHEDRAKARRLGDEPESVDDAPELPLDGLPETEQPAMDRPVVCLEDLDRGQRGRQGHRVAVVGAAEHDRAVRAWC